LSTPSPRSAALRALDPFDLALRFTLLDLLLMPVGDWRVQPFLLGLAGGALLLPGLLRSRTLWIGLTALTALRVGLDWPAGDNHSYLLSYWCLAVTLALVVRDQQESLRVSARLLIGASFACAALWKVILSPDFLDTTFFRVTLLLDARFETVTLLAGVPRELLDALRAALTTHVDGPVATPVAIPDLPTRFLALARFATLWIALFEVGVALVFLWPRDRLARLRDPLLLGFCVTTYAIAPVYGYAWLLLAMGAAQTGRSPVARLGYVAAFGLVLLYRELPWATLLGVAAPAAL
jgi:hypothetical protein